MENKSAPVFKESQNSWINNLAWLPIPILIIGIIILAFLHNEAIWSPTYLIPALNIAFLSLIMFFVSILAARSYLEGRSLPILLLGCGTLVLGLGAFLAGFELLGSNVNATISIYNTSALLSGICYLSSVLLGLKKKPLYARMGWLSLLVAYFAVFAVIFVLVFLIQNHIWPVHFIQGLGATTFGLTIIYVTITFFALSSIFLLANKAKDDVNFRYWYGLGLGLIAVGLFGVSIQLSLGDSLNWIGRISQYLGAIYILIAVFLTIRRTGIWMLPWERALQEIEDRYLNLFMNMTEEVHFWKLVKDENGRIITWRLVDANPPTLKTWNKDLEEIKGKTTDEIFGPGSTEHYMPIVQKVMNEGVSYSYEDYFPNLDKYFRFTTIPLGDYFITTGADITDVKKAQMKLKEAHDNLELKVEERTAELEEMNVYLKENELKLKDAIGELERSNRELQSFAYITSHDLQEPLRNIASFAQLLQRRYKGQLDSDADDFIDFMVDGAARMKEMIQGLLEYSRIDRVGFESDVDMNEMVEIAVSNLQLIVNESNAEITHDTLPTVNSGPNQMIRVFQNLIGNAIKFKKPDFPPRINISVRIDKDRREWIFLVKDNGIGIETEYTERIFDVFKRLHSLGEYDGAGIGLSIVKKIIESNGGRIWVESEFGAGSTFYFTIPIKNNI